MTMKNDGRAKLTEECGELLQVLGKIEAYGFGPHPDGKGHLIDRLGEELADVSAAIKFVIETHRNVNFTNYEKRVAWKLDQYRAWHEEGEKP